jgi:hypothetical protein
MRQSPPDGSVQVDGTSLVIEQGQNAGGTGELSRLYRWVSRL